MPLDIPNKSFFRIGEASSILGIKAHVLRYWESEFKGLSISKSKSGHRLYQERDLVQLAVVRELLYRRRFTIVGAKQRLKEMRADGRGFAFFLEELESDADAAGEDTANEDRATERPLAPSPDADTVAGEQAEAVELGELVVELRAELLRRGEEASALRADVSTLEKTLKEERLIASRALVKVRKQRTRIEELEARLREILRMIDV